MSQGKSWNQRVRMAYPRGYETDVKRCARCGEDHPGMQFDPLTNATDDWAFWAMCPNTRQPILGAIPETPRSVSAIEAFEAKDPS